MRSGFESGIVIIEVNVFEMIGISKNIFFIVMKRLE